MDGMKYLVVDDGMLERPIIFDAGTEHSRIAICLHGAIVSAGIVVHTPIGMQCYGSSVMLQINSRGQKDSDLINRMLGVEND